MNASIRKKEVKSQLFKTLFPTFLFFVGAILVITKQAVIRKSIETSIRLCLSSIIPAILPFMILSDYFMSSITINENSIISILFRKAFSINGVGVIPFIIGNICGFPLGAKIVVQLYECGYISSDEYEKLLPLCSNPSLAFVISGVGLGMRGSIFDGVLLYIIIVLSTIISGILYRKSISASIFQKDITKSAFSFSSSLTSATDSCIYVSAYIIFFSIISGLILESRLPRSFSLILLTFLELGNATSLVSVELKNSILSLPLTAFALGFSGISVYLQSLCFIQKTATGNSYLKMKITEGVIAFILAYLLSFLNY